MRRIRDIHERPDWPVFRWDGDRLAVQLGAVRQHLGILLGRMQSAGFSICEATTLETLTQDAVKTSEIEGEIIDRDAVRSSLSRRLGLTTNHAISKKSRTKDNRADAIAAIVLDATQSFLQPLTKQRLFGWHAILFPAAGGRKHPITVGDWRDDALGPMQIVSGAIGREKIHFVAPSAARVPEEMDAFLKWFEAQSAAADPVLKAFVAHIWFVTIHPFDDGNGRIGRAIADLALARAEGTPQRFYSLSGTLRAERTAYYAMLEAVQKGDLDVTSALSWCLTMLDRAMSDAELVLDATLRKSRFWQSLVEIPLNDRHRLMLTCLLDGFLGKLTSSKWAQIAKCSQDTALRDIEALVSGGVLAKDTAGGRSTTYSLIERM